jgi:hypothetical protein
MFKGESGRLMSVPPVEVLRNAIKAKKQAG